MKIESKKFRYKYLCWHLSNQFSVNYQSENICIVNAMFLHTIFFKGIIQEKGFHYFFLQNFFHSLNSL